MYIQCFIWHGISKSSGPKLEVKGTSLPISLVACETGGAVGHTFSPVDDKVGVACQVHLGARVQGDTAPALKLISACGTVWDTAIIVVVVEAGRAGHVVVGFSAAAQALAVATLPLVCTGMLAVVWTHWRRHRKMGKRSVLIGCKQSALLDTITTKPRMIRVKKTVN